MDPDTPLNNAYHLLCLIVIYIEITVTKKHLKIFDTVPTKRIVIDTSKCDVIELTYEKNSDNIKNHVQER